MKSPHHMRHQQPSWSEHERLKLLEYMVNHIAEEVMMIDSHGRIVYVNEATIKGLGYPRSILLSKHVTEFFRAKMSIQQWRQGHFSALKNARKPLTFQIDRVIRNGHVQSIEVNAVYVVYRNDEFVLSIGRDISAQKRVSDLMEESQRMRTIFNFVSGMSQEIHAPLSLVLNQTRKLLDHFQKRPFEYISYKEFNEILATIRRVQQQIQYCYDTTDRLITLHKQKARVHHKRCDVNSVLRDLLRLLRQQLVSGHVKAWLRLSNNIPRAAIGPLELNQVLHNIIANALQAMPAGGNLRIRTHALSRERQILIEIEDEGVGIPPEHMSRIFEPFFSTKDHGLAKNAGLGLATVYSIVTSCQGNIRITSSQRKGTLVKIFLPIAV